LCDDENGLESLRSDLYAAMHWFVVKEFRRRVSSSVRILGDFPIEVLLGDTPVENSPFTARAFDMSKVKITDFPSVAMLDSSTSFISKGFFSSVVVLLIRSLFS
jgi:hypothetical protein